MPKTEIGRNGVQAAHKKRVKAAGGKSYHFKSPGRRNVPDFIDLYDLRKAADYVEGMCDIKPVTAEKLVRAIVATAVRFTECKAPGKKPRAGQLREHARLRKMGFKVDVVDE